MADKGWTARVAAAAGVAAGTGAAQLGLGYGLGVVVWPAVPADDSVWLGSLGWATWIAASATVFGAVIAGRLGRGTGGPWRFALAASAAVGALLTVALIALPARAAVRTDTFSPQTIAGGYAVIGVLLGLAIAYWAVVSRPVAANLIATAAWLWSLAVAAVVATIFWHRPSATYLSSWQFFSPDSPDDQYGTIYWPSALLTLLAALVIGIIGALPAVRRGDLGVGAASSGAVGPLLVAAAFFVLAPQLTGTPGPLQSAYLIAPYAVLAGLAGSALTVALGQRGAARRRAGSTSGDAVLPASVSSRSSEARGSRSRKAGAVSAKAADSAPTSAEPAAGAAGAGTTSDPEAGVPRARAARSESAAAGAAVVPSPRPAPKGRSKEPAKSDATDTPVAEATPPPADAEPRQRRSLMDRFRRGKATQRDTGSAVDPSAIATGRAKAPASATASAPTSATAAAPRAATAAAPTAPRPAAVPRSAEAPRSGEAPRSAAAPAQAGSSLASAPVSGRSRPARSGVPSVDGNARPASSSASGRSDTRSTVAPPPASPPIAKINDARSGENRPAAPKTAASSAPDLQAGPADAASSDKTPPAQKNPAKSTKATPARATSQPSAPRQARATGSRAATPTKPAAATRPVPPKDAVPKNTGSKDADAKGAPSGGAGLIDEDDTAELPVQDSRRRPGRRAGEDEAR
ncbi:Hansenula MRAKII killer toxin-resistant protein 1 [Actinoplanes sp. NPDC048967]|uniref:Hansenula MRAKII killer toxin-resistant protein 1 n=1 Tax=Actinoplanes sp. NPDC048967 TaxID=3155269 RepID=UPI0033DB8C2E